MIRSSQFGHDVEYCMGHAEHWSTEDLFADTERYIILVVYIYRFRNLVLTIAD